MDHSAVEYAKLRPKEFPARELRETAEGRFWKAFSIPYVAKQVGGVTSLDFCAEKPHHLAVTASTRVIVYDGFMGVNRTFGRFKDKAYCGTFRSDGKLLAAGGENGVVQVFDSNSRSLLRQFSGHRRPVHTVLFSPDKLHLLSGGDDASVRWWDISSGAQISRMDGHSDYVRAAAVSPVSHDLWATGGYDHMCKLWDARTHASVGAMNHGGPIEALAFFPSESLLITAGGQHLCCWDLVSGGRLLHKLTAHQKTITSVAVQHIDSSSSGAKELRVISASLDGHVKVFNPENFKLTHASKYPAPILSLALAPDGKSLAVGMADGTLSVRQRRVKASQKLESGHGTGTGCSRTRYAPRLTAASFRYFIRGQSSKAAVTDLVVAGRRKAGLATYDRLLRRFRYREALDAALETRRAEVVSAVIEELVNRNALGAALSGRDASMLSPIIKHTSKYITDPRYTQTLSSLCHQLLDTYALPLAPSMGGGGGSGTLLASLEVLQERVNVELRVQDDLFAIKGMLDSLLSAGAA